MSPIKNRVAVLVVVMLVSGLAVPGAAAPAPRGDGGTQPRDVTEGTLLWRPAAGQALVPAPALETDVEMRVTGMLVRATVRQAFTNPSGEWAEGVYVFPLPEDAAVDHLRMRIGDRIIDGVIRERAAAKETYERAKQEGKRAGLVEQERPNIFTTSLANIPPGASITVEIEYQQVIRWDQGQLRLRFPMVVGPRYIPGAPLPAPPDGTGWAEDTDRVSDASRITPPVRHPARGPINPVSLRIELAPGMPLARLEAPYHEIRTVSLSGGRHEITLAEGAVPADRDFELVWQPQAGVAPAAVVFTETTAEEAFALLMVMPPAAAELETPRVPRELIFVVDTSGSMHGASIEQAKAALRLALARLQPTDTFNIIRFNHRTDSLFADAQAASGPNVQLADRYVAGLRADGGTEMLPALTRALDGRERSDRLRQVIFLTDGAVGNEEQLFTTIQERLGDSRLFTIGIGSAPNSHFMREAARYGRGTFTYIGSATEVQAKMDALFRKIESPALTDLRLELGGVSAEGFPEQIPDLYLGEPVTVVLRSDVLPAWAVLRGRLGGAEWQQEIELPPASEGAGLSVHWARAKIASLADTRGAGSAGEEIRRAVIEVALKHHLVSRYTSLVAVDVTPVRPLNEVLHGHALETNLPDGWDYTALSGLGQGATAAPLHVALGLIALLLAAGMYVMLRFEIVVARSRRDRDVA